MDLGYKFLVERNLEFFTTIAKKYSTNKVEPTYF